MVLYQSFWSRLKREALLFGAVYLTCLLLALLFNLVSLASERLQLSIPLHEAPNREAYMLQALAPLPLEKYTPNNAPTVLPNSLEVPQAIISSKKK
jgi:hypothetical protein